MESTPKTSWRPFRIIVIFILAGLLTQAEAKPNASIPFEIIVFGQVILFVWLAAEVVLWLSNKKSHAGKVQE